MHYEVMGASGFARHAEAALALRNANLAPPARDETWMDEFLADASLAAVCMFDYNALAGVAWAHTPDATTYPETMYRVAVEPLATPQETVHCSGLHVAPPFRNMGVGLALAVGLLGTARHAKLATCLLSPNNWPSRHIANAVGMARPMPMMTTPDGRQLWLKQLNGDMAR